MSLTKAIGCRPWLGCALIAFALRLGLAVVTEYAPIFPGYYYTDSRLMDRLGREIAETWTPGKPIAAPTSQRAQGLLIAAIYKLVGPRPLAAKAFSALAAAAAVGALVAFVAFAFGVPAALASGLFVAFWPSHAFYSSQIFKDPLVILGATSALAVASRMIARPAASVPALAGFFILLIATGLLRSYVMLAVAGSIAFCAGWATLRRARGGRPWRAAALLFAVALATPVAFRPLSRWVWTVALPTTSGGEHPSDLTLVPASVDTKTGAVVRPLSPQSIAEFRRFRQEADRTWARQADRTWARQDDGREISTQLFYGERFESWLDVLKFLPRGAFYTLFMPLPGLYPIGGSVGRLLASVENSLLLLLAVLAALGIRRLGVDAARAVSLVFFLAMAGASSLLEVDLGSATRHRTLYFPMLLPFAFFWLPRPHPHARNRKLKALEVLECGGPGGTGNQAISICEGLDPARFEPVLVFAARGTPPAAFAARLPERVRSVHVRELVREIRPLKDLQALRRLVVLFRAEKPDIVHLHSSKAGVLGRLAAWWTGVPRIYYSPHGYAFLQQDRSALTRAFYRVVELALGWIGEIVAVSPSEAALARPLSWHRKVHTISDPYLPQGGERRRAARSEGLRIGALGRLSPARRPESFVLLAQRLTDSRNGLRCVWIGGGELERAVRGQIEDLNLSGKLELTGMLPPAQAAARLAELDVLVHYSAWDALPNAVLEAMAAGIPVVASDIPGCRDALGDAGLLAKDEVELLELCLSLADSAPLRKRLGEAGRKRVAERFSREKALAALEELYSS